MHIPKKMRYGLIGAASFAAALSVEGTIGYAASVHAPGDTQEETAGSTAPASADPIQEIEGALPDAGGDAAAGTGQAEVSQAQWEGVDGAAIVTTEIEGVVMETSIVEGTVELPAFTFTDVNVTLYALRNAFLRLGPDEGYDIAGVLEEGAAVEITGQCDETGWYRCTWEGQEVYISGEDVTAEVHAAAEPASYNGITEGDIITCTATYYCTCTACCGKSDGVTASGLVIQNGVEPETGVIACNWLPLNTVVMIGGEEYSVADRGGGSLSEVGRIDIFEPGGHEAALEKGRTEGLEMLVISFPPGI